MRGSIKKRYEGSWSLILELGYQPDPKTGAMKRKQKWITFRGNQRQAEKKLAELVNAHNNNELVEPSKVTVGEWLLEWVDKAIKPPKKRQGTYNVYRRLIEKNLIPALGAVRLQQLKALDIERLLPVASVTMEYMSPLVNCFICSNSPPSPLKQIVLGTL